MLEQIKHIDWSKFHFLRDEYLWLAIPIFVIVLIGLVFYRESNKWKKYIANDLQEFVIQRGTEWKYRLMHLSVLIMFIFGFIAFLGPSWDEIELPSKKINSQFVIALDLSQSMLAEDISPNRLERAKFKIQDLLEANPRAETSLLVFAGSAHTVIPFTTDYKLIIDQVDGLKPSMMPVKGTGFDALFIKIDSLFNANKATARILLITDDFVDISIETVSEFLQENNVELYLYPFATQSGANIPGFNEHSALDLHKLSILQAMDKVKILEITLDNSDVKDLAKLISNELVFEDKGDEKEDNWQDNGFWFIIPLAFIFLFSFRKGWALNLVFIAFIFGSCSPENQQKANDFTFNDLWFKKEYQAQKMYDAENYLEAAVAFEDPLRKGTAYYKAGDFMSAKTALEKDTSTVGLYNLGLTYAKLGMLDKSQEVFEKVLQREPNNKNAAANLQHIIAADAELKKLKPEDAALNEDGEKAQNGENKSPEDLSGGGQEAKKKDMEKERLAETVETATRKAKELDELPDDFKPGKGEIPKNVLMRKVDDDPALFLKRKFKYQIKKKIVKADSNLNKW